MERRFYQARSQVLECLQHSSQRQEMLRYALGLADMMLGEWETAILQEAIDALKVAVDRGLMAGLRLRNVSLPVLPNRPPPPQQTPPPSPPPTSRAKRPRVSSRALITSSPRFRVLPSRNSRRPTPRSPFHIYLLD